jgi:hypothetical protein
VRLAGPELSALWLRPCSGVRRSAHLRLPVSSRQGALRDRGAEDTLLRDPTSLSLCPAKVQLPRIAKPPRLASTRGLFPGRL